MSTPGRGDNHSPLVPLAIALGERPEPAIAATLAALGAPAWPPPPGAEVVLATGAGSGPGLAAAREVAALVESAGGQARLVVPGRLPGAGLTRRGGRAAWVEIDLTGTGARIERVGVRRALFEAPVLLGVGTFAGAAAPGALALALWREHVTPRLALTARLAGGRAPLIADLALAVRPHLMLLVGTWRRLSAAIASPDQLAVELAALALHERRPDDARPRPWEDPLVQRATELGLGLSHPSAIAPRLVWSGTASEAAAGHIATLRALLTDELDLTWPARDVTLPPARS